MRKTGSFALFALGFRPFFLAAGISALVLLGLWLAFWQGVVPAKGYFTLVEWHAHEMLFGYTAAVIAGFLLTAVKNWTGMAVPVGRLLVIIATVWLLGRVLVVTPDAPGWLVALLDLAFIPLVGWSLWRPLWHGPNKVNRMFLLIFAGMTLANLLVHLDVAGIAKQLWPRGVYLMADMVLLVLLLVAGRVVPFFTEKAVMGARSQVRPWVEKATFVSMVLAAVAELVLPHGPVAGIALLAAALIQGIRLSGWYHPGIWRVPILWVLHIGYAWLVLGLALRGLAGFGLLPSSVALHAITVGGIGVLTLGMMSRVALGHTGRNINDTGPLIPVAFVLLNLGAVVRVFGPLFMAEKFDLWINIAGGLWMLAFLVFVLVYTPILIKPRVDGRPG
ncbi:MAG TPA: NnrS family protein [Thiolapillus brandeum]|uniref:NnrS family protein n=1 Tax=Thiolapillus brandeum TaxID=1076588 RepID=A0A831K882_9GAMM|nr:NnrS family protein [Thiolapillus brandeum]